MFWLIKRKEKKWCSGIHYQSYLLWKFMYTFIALRKLLKSVYLVLKNSNIIASHHQGWEAKWQRIWFGLGQCLEFKLLEAWCWFTEDDCHLMLLGPRESILTPYFLGPLDITSLMSRGYCGHTPIESPWPSPFPPQKKNSPKKEVLQAN